MFGSAFDTRVPVDISVKYIKTATGHKIIVLDQKDRDTLKIRFAGKANVKLIERYPVSMTGQIVEESKQ